MSSRRYAILGAGALGGFYGCKLAAAGLDVHFLLHSDYDHVRRHGLVMDSPRGNVRLPKVNAYGRAADMPPCDVALLAVKATANDRLAELLPPAVAPDGVAVACQNGLGVEDRMAELIGPRRVMGGLCFLCSHKAGPGHIRHLDYGYITLAEYDPEGRPRGITDRMRGIAGDFQAAGIGVELAGDLLEARWKKLVWNVPFNGLCVVLNTTTAAVMADPHAAALAEALMREIASGAAAAGKTIDEPFIQRMLDQTRRMTPYHPSMVLDHRSGHAMEIEAIFGNPLRAAADRGCALPRLEALYQQLKFLDAARS
jgi:2-dehydropantoate 2-reductase